jgi:2-desacetyl-2-hydroxyethyl bacteriochlorophyllide A dehydrogenase
MKALICNKPGELKLIEVPKPDLKKDHALVRIRRIGICGTDLHAYQGTQPFFSYPRILGHELAGEIIDIDGTDDFVKGELVTFIPYINCQECASCRRGFTNCCEQIRVFGVHTDGGMQEYVTIPVRLLLKVNSMPLDEIALVEPLAIAAHGVNRGRIATGEQVLVIGAGPIGVGLIQFAKLKGANVTIMDLSDSRLKFCREVLNVEQTINPLEKDHMEKLALITKSRMFSVVFDATGNINALNAGFNYMGYTGRYVLVGLQLKEIHFSHPEFHKREGNLMSSRNATRSDFEEVLRVISAQQIRPLNMVTHTVQFDAVPAHFPSWLDAHNNVLKVMVTLD